MHPYRVSISFLGTAWGALDVEVYDPELETDSPGQRPLDQELIEFGASFGFGDVQLVTLVGLEYQIAQKIHAVTDPGYVRAHDLVDLQLLWSIGPDLSRLRELCVRTFAWRNQQSWPPIPLRSVDGWALAYADAREETEVDGRTRVLPHVNDARDWLTEQITALTE
ncbi:hypothetical protein FM113_07730 [Leucobacter sp. 7(1)]|nr:hypothetical protein FM113_07730 [Leucobacter sp. 7(1)]